MKQEMDNAAFRRRGRPSSHVNAPKTKDDGATRRFIVMGCGSALLHLVLAAIILPGIGSEKSSKAYNVELKYLQPKIEPVEDSTASAPEKPERVEPPEKPAQVDLTRIDVPLLPEIEETTEFAEETTENVDIVNTVAVPVPPLENVIIPPQDSGADAEPGGGNSLLATAGTGRGWGGDESGVGWGGGSGSTGSGSGTGGGTGSGTDGGTRGSRGRAEEPGVYFAGMQGITPPVYERTPQPLYPSASRSRSEQGEVLLRIEVLTNGRVGRVEVEKTSGYARLDDAAVKTVRDWRFKPALKGRETVICWVNIPVTFRLN